MARALDLVKIGPSTSQYNQKCQGAKKFRVAPTVPEVYALECHPSVFDALLPSWRLPCRNHFQQWVAPAVTVALAVGYCRHWQVPPALYLPVPAYLPCCLSICASAHLP